MKIELSPSGSHFIVYPKDDARSALEIAITAAGARAIADILLAQRLSPPRIGTPAFPTQAQIHKFLSARVAEEKEAVAERLAELNLEIDL